MAIQISPYVEEPSDEDDRDEVVSDRSEPRNRPQAEEQADDAPQRGPAPGQAGSQGQAPPRIRLVFQGQQSYEERGPLLALARTIGLDVWGNYLLNRRAVIPRQTFGGVIDPAFKTELEHFSSHCIEPVRFAGLH